MKIVIVYNPKSGSALTRGELRKKCEVAKLSIEAFVEIGQSTQRKLSSFIKRGANIAVVGGDGTISAVAGMLVGTKATLVPLPGGTLNHFTSDLGVPQDLDEAFARLAKLRPKLIDVASVNGLYFINNSSMGLYPASLRSRNEIEDKVGKWPAAVSATIGALFRLKTYTVTIGKRTFRSPFIFVGNNRYELGDLGGTERKRLDEGLLTILAAKTQSRLTLFKIALFTFFGKARELPEFDEFHAEKVTIKIKGVRHSVSHDGEVSSLTSPLSYELHTKALRVLS